MTLFPSSCFQPFPWTIGLWHFHVYFKWYYPIHCPCIYIYICVCVCMYIFNKGILPENILWLNNYPIRIVWNRTIGYNQHYYVSWPNPISSYSAIDYGEHINEVQWHVRCVFFYVFNLKILKRNNVQVVWILATNATSLHRYSYLTFVLMAPAISSVLYSWHLPYRLSGGEVGRRSWFQKYKLFGVWFLRIIP